MSDVHDLTGSVNTSAIYSLCHYIRMRLHHPCRNRISRSSNDDIDSCLFHCVHYTFYMRKVKRTLLRLTGTPCRLCNPYCIDSCFFHHCNVLLQTVIWHIFIIICRSEKKFLHYNHILLLISVQLAVDFL